MREGERPQAPATCSGMRPWPKRFNALSSAAVSAVICMMSFFLERGGVYGGILFSEGLLA